MERETAYHCVVINSLTTIISDSFVYIRYAMRNTDQYDTLPSGFGLLPPATSSSITIGYYDFFWVWAIKKEKTFHNTL